jgi:hypothetical protein
MHYTLPFRYLSTIIPQSIYPRNHPAPTKEHNPTTLSTINSVPSTGGGLDNPAAALLVLDFAAPLPVPVGLDVVPSLPVLDPVALLVELDETPENTGNPDCPAANSTTLLLVELKTVCAIPILLLSKS